MRVRARPPPLARSCCRSPAGPRLLAAAWTALPISISFGIMFYFASAKVLVPFVDDLAANQIYV